MKNRVRITCDDETLTHIAYTGEGYSTLCGLDGEDPGIGQFTIDRPKRGKIDCEHCARIAAEGRNWRKSDFAEFR